MNYTTRVNFAISRYFCYTTFIHRRTQTNRLDGPLYWGKRYTMRRLLLLAVEIIFLFMLAPSPGFIHADPDTGQGNEPVLMQDGNAPQAVLMRDGTCYVMADGTTRCQDTESNIILGALMNDPTSGKATALKIWRKPTPLIVTTRRPEVAFSICVRKPHHPLALVLTWRNTVRA
mgnify:CR=1 FL=1